MEKYIAKQYDYDYLDFELLIDDCGLTSEGGDNCAVYGLSPDCVFLNEEEYTELTSRFSGLLDEVDDLMNGSSSWYETYKEILESYGVKYSPRTVKRIKELAEDYRESPEEVAELLTLTTGKPWIAEVYRGYSQGDICTLIYCEDEHDSEYMNLIGMAALGCAREFAVSELVETDGRSYDELADCADCGGFFVTDDDIWSGRVREKLARDIGCEPAEVLILRPQEVKTISYVVADYE